MPRSVLRRVLPDADALRANRALRWLGPLLERPWLWRLDRRGVSLGLAIGVFFGVLLPLGQILFAAGAAVLVRANLPAAALATFISNPLTTPAIVAGAYALGARVLGAPLVPTAEGDWWAQLGAMGEPLLAGLAIAATTGAVLTYLGVRIAWRLSAWRRLARRAA